MSQLHIAVLVLARALPERGIVPHSRTAAARARTAGVLACLLAACSSPRTLDER